jgi:hypothetical protein
MEPPKSAEIFESVNSKYWFEGDLLYVISKKTPQPDMETLIKQNEELKKRLGGKKICAIIDVTHASPSSKEAREYNRTEIPKMFKAIAFIITNPVSRMLANLYLGVKPMSFPVKMCTGEEEALEWVKKYL